MSSFKPLSESVIEISDEEEEEEIRGRGNEVPYKIKKLASHQIARSSVTDADFEPINPSRQRQKDTQNTKKTLGAVHSGRVILKQGARVLDPFSMFKKRDAPSCSAPPQSTSMAKPLDKISSCEPQNKQGESAVMGSNTKDPLRMDHDYSTMPRSQTPPPLSPTSGFFKVEVPISSTVGVRDEAAKTVEAPASETDSAPETGSLGDNSLPSPTPAPPPSTRPSSPPMSRVNSSVSPPTSRNASPPPILASQLTFTDAEDEIKQVLQRNIKLYFIPLVSKHPSLWKNKNECHRLGTVRDNDWEQILSALKEKFGRERLTRHRMDTVKGIKTIWNSLRGYYMVIERKRKGTSGASAEEVRIPDWPFYASMTFLRESLACLPTSSSVGVGDEGTEGSSSSGSGIQKWHPKEARVQHKKKMSERLITAMENISSGSSQRKEIREEDNEEDAFFSWIRSAYKNMEPEKKKAFKGDITTAMIKYM